MAAKKEPHRASLAAAAHIDNLLDEALKQTFPASDAVAINIERGFDERFPTPALYSPTAEKRPED